MAEIDPRGPAAAALARACGPVDPYHAAIADRAGAAFRAEFDRLSRRALALFERHDESGHEWDLLAIDDDGGLTTIGAFVGHGSEPEIGTAIARYHDGLELLAMIDGRYEVAPETRRLIAGLG